MVWVDTCCIDKRSSADLSEAINSMWYGNQILFEISTNCVNSHPSRVYYQLAEEAYIRLTDVPGDGKAKTFPWIEIFGAASDRIHGSRALGRFKSYWHRRSMSSVRGGG